MKAGGSGERPVGGSPQGGDSSRHQVPAEAIAIVERETVNDDHHTPNSSKPWSNARLRCADCARRWCAPGCGSDLPGLSSLCSRSAMACGRISVRASPTRPFALTIAAALATGSARCRRGVRGEPSRSVAVVAAVTGSPRLPVWIGTIGYGCIADWVSIGPDGPAVRRNARMFRDHGVDQHPARDRAGRDAAIRRPAAHRRRRHDGRAGNCRHHVGGAWAAARGRCLRDDTDLESRNGRSHYGLAGLLGGGLFAWFEARCTRLSAEPRRGNNFFKGINCDLIWSNET